MGARLVALALTRWAPHVSDRGFRILIRMAHTALDSPTDNVPANLYFGGHDLLMSVMTAERGGTQETRERNLRRAVNDLIDIGAIRRTNRARSGANQVYELTLSAVVKAEQKPPRKARRIDEPPVDTSTEGDFADPPQGDTSDPPQGGSWCPPRGTPETPPRNQEEPRDELYEDKQDHLRGPLTERARDEPHEEMNDSPPKCDHPGCAKGFVLTEDGSGIARCPKCNSNVIPFPERKSA